VWIGEFAQVNADVRRLIKHVRSLAKRLLRRFDGENQSRLVLWDGRRYTHFTKVRIDIFVENVAGDWIRQRSKASQGWPVIAINKRVSRDCWQLRVLQITEIVVNRKPLRVEAHPSTNLFIEHKLAVAGEGAKRSRGCPKSQSFHAMRAGDITSSFIRLYSRKVASL